jgi:predicted dehydrogenase
MTERLRIGVIGGGLVAQAVHLPNLSGLGEHFELVAIADASPTVASRLAERYSPAQAFTDWRALIDGAHPDAVLVCSPNHTHAEITLAAVGQGVHALVEKPLCIDPQDARIIAERRSERGVVVQVGYMKRYDPAYQAFLDALPESPEELHLVSVTTYDPSLAREPFVPAAELVLPLDLSAGARAAGLASEREQVARATGRSDPRTVRAFSHTFLGCLIHDVNLVHGALDRMGQEVSLTPRAAAHWAHGDGASVMVDLPNGAAWNCTWIQLPSLEAFREHAAFYFTGSIHEINFPAPYDLSGPVRRSITSAEDGHRVEIVQESRGGGFLNELRHFHACITEGARCRTPPEQAARDLDLLRDAFITTARRHEASPSYQEVAPQRSS